MRVHMRMSFTDVFGLVGKQFKVLKGVVGGVAINVVYDLFRCEEAPKVLFHNESVF